MKLRRFHRDLYVKFVDTTRPYISPPHPYGSVELWVEKDAIRSFLEGLAMKYRVPIQVERGFGSISMFRDALIRARNTGVGKILYIGDFDPSGLLIEEVNAQEMGVEIERVALTLEQVSAYNPPARSVNMKDSRAPSYMSIYGDKCWEVEALNPEILLRVIESELKKNVPAEFLEEVAISERASKVAQKLAEPMIKRLTEEARRLIHLGLSDEEIMKRLGEGMK